MDSNKALIGCAPWIIIISVVGAVIGMVILLGETIIDGIAYGGNLKEGQEFNEDVAWVRQSKTFSYDRWCLYDTEGNILFQLERRETPATRFAQGVSVISAETGGGNNVSVSNRLINTEGETIIELDDEYHICNTYSCFNVDSNNDVINSESHFNLRQQGEFNWGESFTGYVLVCKKTETYDTNMTERGIISPNGSWLQPLQESFLEGFVYDSNGVFKKALSKNAETIHYLCYDIKTNQFFESTFPSDWDSVNEELKFRNSSVGIQGFYNPSNQLIIDLSEYTIETNNSYVPYFMNDVCNLLHKGADGNDYIVKIDKAGNVVDEPHLINAIMRMSPMGEITTYSLFTSTGATLTVTGEVHNFVLEHKESHSLLLRDFNSSMARVEIYKPSAFLQFMASFSLQSNNTGKIVRIYYVNPQGEEIVLEKP